MPKRRRVTHDVGSEDTKAAEFESQTAGSHVTDKVDGESCAAVPEEDEIAILEANWQRCLRSVVQSRSFPPLVLCEVRFREEVLRLRQHFASLLQRVLGEASGANPPREAFNRWLQERANRAHGGEEVDSSRLAPGLYQEILEDIPIKVPHVFPADSAGQRKRLREFLDALKAWMAKHRLKEEELPAAFKNAEKVLASELDGPADALLLTDLRRGIAPLIARIEGPQVAMLISELETSAQKVYEAVEVLRREILHADESDAEVDATSDHQGHTVIVARVEGIAVEATSVSIGAPCLERLGMLLQLTLARLRGLTQGDDAEAEIVSSARALADGVNRGRGGFWRLVFCVLCRYTTLCGPGKGEGQGLQAAVPPAALHAVARHLSVWPALSAPIECCASPLNCRATGTCPRGLFGSLCPEVDTFFGSFGSFFSDGFAPRVGLFEVNPPFEFAVMGRCSRKILQLLGAAEHACQGLAFVVFMPEWQTPWTVFAGPTAGELTSDIEARSDTANTPLSLLLESRFCRGSFVARQQQHSYVHGLSYTRGQDGDRLMRATGKSRCIVLQTSRCFSSTPPTEVFWQELKAAWRAAGSGPKRQRAE